MSERARRVGRALRHPAAWAVSAVLLVGIAGTVVALAHRESDTEFVYRQQSLRPLDPGRLERLLLATRDPRPGHHGQLARTVQCHGAGSSVLRNPWTCSLRYVAPGGITLRVVVSPDGSVRGVGAGGSVTVRGCCVAPGTG